jgi:hypothetical protein
MKSYKITEKDYIIVDKIIKYGYHNGGEFWYVHITFDGPYSDNYMMESEGHCKKVIEEIDLLMPLVGKK